MIHDGFQYGKVYTCNDCGKRTRGTRENTTDRYCIKCEEMHQHENLINDNWEYWSKEDKVEPMKTMEKLKKKYEERKRVANNG